MARNTEAYQRRMQEHRTNRREKKYKRLALDLLEDQQNSCGACEVCCIVPSLSDTAYTEPKDKIIKGIYEPCRYLCSQREGMEKKGCSIYEHHPDSCKYYFCLWQAGFLNTEGKLYTTEDLRPDKIGLLFEIRGEGELSFLQVWEVWKGALEGFDRFHTVCNFLMKRFKMYLVVRLYGGADVKIFGTLEFRNRVLSYLGGVRGVSAN